MIQTPCVELEMRRAAREEVHLPCPQRIQDVICRWRTYQRLEHLEPVRVELRRVPPSHAGLGSGTQLALAVAAGLNALAGFGKMTPTQLAMSTGRGQRSAVGTYGFALGGMIVERGKCQGEPLAPLAHRLEVPAAWCFVLARPVHRQGLSGQREQHVFSALPAVSASVRSRLVAQVEHELVPAVRDADFAAFSTALYRYGRTAGSCFAAVQGGPYNGRQLATLVQRIRDWGVEGVGQSSWGPTLFAVVANRQQAHHLVAALRQGYAEEELNLEIAQTDNRGAVIECRAAAD